MFICIYIIYLYILTLSGFYIECQMYRILRIFNGLLQTKSVKKQLQDEKNNIFA